MHPQRGNGTDTLERHQRPMAERDLAQEGREVNQPGGMSQEDSLSKEKPEKSKRVTNQGPAGLRTSRPENRAQTKGPHPIDPSHGTTAGYGSKIRMMGLSWFVLSFAPLPGPTPMNGPSTREDENPLQEEHAAIKAKTNPFESAFEPRHTSTFGPQDLSGAPNRPHRTQEGQESVMHS